MKRPYFTPEAHLVIVTSTRCLMQASMTVDLQATPVDDDTDDFEQFSRRRNSVWDDNDE